MQRKRRGRGEWSAAAGRVQGLQRTCDGNGDAAKAYESEGLRLEECDHDGGWRPCVSDRSASVWQKVRGGVCVAGGGGAPATGMKGWNTAAMNADVRERPMINPEHKHALAGWGSLV